MAPRRKLKRSASPDQIEERLREIEGDLDTVLTEAAAESSADKLDPVRRRRLEHVLATFTRRMESQLKTIEPPEEEQLMASALELLHPDQLLRLAGRLRMRHRSEEVDEFGADPKVEAQLAPAVDFLYQKYFRVDAEGVANIPERGRCLLVANRSGVLPWDSLMIKSAVERDHQRQRRVRWLIEDFVFNQPFLGPLISQVGGVRACQENAERLLFHEELVCVFPEGIIGAVKPYAERYRLGRFGRGGYVKLALRTGTPIVPVAVIGAEEVHPVIGRMATGSKGFLGFPFLPVTPTFPALGPLGLVPAPTKWTVVFGEPIELNEKADAVTDLVLVRRLNERVRTTVQAMVTEAVRKRRSLFFG